MCFKGASGTKKHNLFMSLFTLVECLFTHPMLRSSARGPCNEIQALLSRSSLTGYGGDEHTNDPNKIGMAFTRETLQVTIQVQQKCNYPGGCVCVCAHAHAHRCSLCPNFQTLWTWCDPGSSCSWILRQNIEWAATSYPRIFPTWWDGTCVLHLLPCRWISTAEPPRRPSRARKRSSKAHLGSFER